MKLKKGDEIKVVSGKEKGKTGKIDKVFSKEQAVLIEGINSYKRHKKARTATEKSQVVTFSKPLAIAQVMMICPKCHSVTRIGYASEENEKRRICRKCEQAI